MSFIGGGILKNFNASNGWGVNPSSASGVALLGAEGGGTSFSLGVGQFVVYSFGSVSSFTGVVSEVGNATSFGQGVEQTFQVVDNRVRLGWQMVYAAFNIEDDLSRNHLARPDGASASDGNGLGTNASVGFGTIGHPGTPIGASEAEEPAMPWERRRMYRHMLPQNWQSGIWTYTDRPYTTTEILDLCFDHSWGDFGFTRNYHSDLNDSILTGMDWTGGIKLSNLISEINGKTGLDLIISGSHTLIWGRKGDGLPPLPDSSCTPIASGVALTSSDSGVRVCGDPVRIQRLNVTMVPDWQSGWNAFIDELAWIREVADVFEMPTATKADLLDLAAFARTVTVYQYAKKKADMTLLDTRPFGQRSRANLPAWVYIRELVYRSYRIPSSFKLHGVPLSSLEIADCLLCNTDVTGEGLAGKQCYATDPIQFYPGVQATAITRGQPLDLINARDIRLFYRNSTGDLRNEWATAPSFEVDTNGKSIRFAVPTFIDGDPATGKSIYLRINKGEGGGDDLTSLLEAESDYLDVIVPNPDYQIQPAEVRASFCFIVGRFFKDYGKGPRRGGISASGLGLHVLDMASDSDFSSAAVKSLDPEEIRLPDVSGAFKEVVYNDGGSALDKADKIAKSAMELSNIQATGGFTRNGMAGTVLTPVVDNVTVSVEFGGGITERVEYAKARSTSAALAERTLQRIQRTEEIYPGQDALRREVREYKMLASANRTKSHRRSRSHNSFNDLFEKPAGSETPGTVSVLDKHSAAPVREGVKKWLAGDLVWLDAAGFPVSSGGVFGGVLVSTPKMLAAGSGGTQSKELTLAYSGRVPVRVKAGVPVNGIVVADPGAQAGGSAGAVTVGRLAHGEATPSSPSGELLAMVDLGGGGAGGDQDLKQLVITDSRPDYVPLPASEVADGYKRFYITWGVTNGTLADNWNNCVDVPTGAETVRYIAMKAFLKPTGDNIIVTHCEWVTYTQAQKDAGTFDTPDYSSTGGRPAHMFIPIGMISVSDSGVASIIPNGSGSIGILEYVADISFSSSGVKYKKALSAKRIRY